MEVLPSSRRRHGILQHVVEDVVGRLKGAHLTFQMSHCQGRAATRTGMRENFSNPAQEKKCDTGILIVRAEKERFFDFDAMIYLRKTKMFDKNNFPFYTLNA